jgi:hypothetical protein
VTTWTEIDEPILRWLLEREEDPGWTGRLHLTMRPEPETLSQFGGLDNAEVDAALVPLADHMLIAGNRGETTGYARWTSLRLRADGLILLGEWPDLDRIASATGLETLIAALAEDAEDAEDRTALRRTAGAVGRLGEGVIEETIASIAIDAAGGSA